MHTDTHLSDESTACGFKLRHRRFLNQMHVQARKAFVLKGSEQSVLT